MQSISYKGYRLCLDENDEKAVCIRLSGIRDLVICSVTDFDMIADRFTTLVEEYTRVCSIIGKKPQSPFPDELRLNLDGRVQRYLEDESYRKKVTVEKLIEDIVKEYVKTR